MAAINRRRFVISTVALGAAAITAYVVGTRYWNRREEDVELTGTTDEERLLTVFRDPESAATVGRRFLTVYPDRENPDLLATLKSEIVLGGTPLSELSAREIVANAAERIRRDFAENRVVEFDGWVLSRTEVSLCTLAAVGGGRVGVGQ